MSDRDFEAVNALAMDQISRLERGEAVEVVPQIHYNTQRGSLWDSETDATRRWSPSSNPTAATPGRGVPVMGASTYANNGRYNYNVGGVDSPEALYRRTLNAVFKDTARSTTGQPQTQSTIQEPRANRTRKIMKEENIIRTSLSPSSLQESSFVHGGLNSFSSNSPNSSSSKRTPAKRRDKVKKSPQYVPESVHTPTNTVQMIKRGPLLGHETKTNFTAIALSSVARMATTLVASWAREKGVPYHLL